MASLDDVVTNMNNGVNYIGQLVGVMRDTFPQQNGSASTASAGAATLPANPVKFLVVTVDGSTFKVPLYNP